MNKQTNEQRIEKIENWLIYDGGTWYYDFVLQIIRISLWLVLGYIFVNILWSVTIVTIVEYLPTFCESI